MKKSILMLFVAALFTVQLAAQEECGYVPDPAYIKVWKDKNSIQNKRLDFLKKYSLKNVEQIQEIRLDNGKFTPIMQKNIRGDDAEGDLFDGNRRTVPLVAHIVRRSNGTGGLSTADLNASITRANNFYAGANMRFVLCETKYINSDAMFNNNFRGSDDNAGNANASFNRLNVTTRNAARKLNIYFVPNSSTSWAWRPNTNSRSQHILMRNDHAQNQSTLSHEIGHWFDLLHTHGGGDELVNGSNCSTSGDFVCDTPADPRLSSRVDSNCRYTGGTSILDANGMAYNPDPRNILSYSRKSCRNRFSDGQIYRMQAAYLGMNTDRGYTFSLCPVSNFNIVGTWKNTDANTRGIPYIVVTSGGTKIQAYGSCHPNFCEWDKVALMKSGSTYQTTYDQGFAKRKITITPVSANKIKLKIFTNYSDSRPNRTDTHYMKRFKFDITGTWYNKDSKTRGVTKFIASNNGTKIQTFGSCHPTDCDWKTVSLSKSGLLYKATYTPSFATKKLVITPLSANEIKLTVATDYRDSRQDKTSTYYLKKSFYPVIFKNVYTPKLLSPEGQ